MIETPYGFGGVGPDIKAEFEAEAALTGIFEDFDGIAGSNFSTLPTAPGATFSSNIGTTGSPISVNQVRASTFSGRVGTIIGTPFNGGSDDGRVGYQVVFDTPQQYAGIQRYWNDQTLTEFYNAADKLIFSFTGESTPFVGFAADPNDPSTWVKRIQMDTTAASSSRQVGYSDDLIYGTGTLTIPEPRTYALMALGAAMLGLFWWRRR